MAGHTRHIEDTKSLNRVPDSESIGLYHRVLWLGAFSGAISDFSFLSSDPIDRESMIRQWLSSVRIRFGHRDHITLADFQQQKACLERMERMISDGALPAPCKTLPTPLSNNVRCESAAMEEQLHKFACESFKIRAIPTSGADVSGPTISLCVLLCGLWGYRLPKSFEHQMFLAQIWNHLPPTRGQVKDIGGGKLETEIGIDLKYSLETGKDLPKELFYLESPWPGSDISDQTRGETEILKPLAGRLADRLHKRPNLLILELGAGDSSKTKILLDELESREHCCRYWAVEINKKLLDSNIQQLKERYTHVECSGLYGTFDEAMELAANVPGKKVIMSLGSTATNFSYGQVVENLQTYCEVADLVILGQQGPDGTVPHHDVYHTKQFERFIWDGLLDTGNRILETTEFNTEEWGITCETKHEPWRHNFIIYRQGKKFRTFASIKYTESEVSALAELAGAPRPEIHRHPETGMRIYVLNPQKRPVGNMNNAPEAPIQFPAARTCRVRKAQRNQPGKLL
ncbi:hypothetical protein ACJZ2D_014945 [Fusarium nematophilum]